VASLVGSPKPNQESPANQSLEIKFLEAPTQQAVLNQEPILTSSNQKEIDRAIARDIKDKLNDLK
jgi:hypothetical protein